MSKRNLIIPLIILSVIVLFINMIKVDKKRDPITITGSASIEEMSLDGLISEADIIVIGEVDKIHPSRWNTPNGKFPVDKTPKTISAKNNTIYTDLNFISNQIIKGKNKKVLRLRTFGGQVDQDTMIIPSEASLESGQIYLLFLFVDRLGLTANIDLGHYIVLGSIQGVYRINDGKAVSFRDEWNLDELIAYIQNKLSESEATETAPSSTNIPEATVEATTPPTLEETATSTP